MEENYLLSLIVLFFFSFAFFKKNPENKAISETAKNISDNKNDDLTGVEKYMQNKQGISLEVCSETGVEKYLSIKENDSSVSGVNKYMAQQAILAREKAKNSATGVEKYINNRR